MFATFLSLGACSKKGGRCDEGGAQAGGEGTWRTKEGETEQVEGCNVLEIVFFEFHTPLARPFSLPIWHVALRAARRYVCTFFTALTAHAITYFSSKRFPSRLNAVRREMFCLAVFYAIWLYFHLFRKFFLRVILIFLFLSGAGKQCTRPLPCLLLQPASQTPHSLIV